MSKHDRDQALDALCGTLSAKVKRFIRSKRFTEDHNCLYVCILKGLKRVRQFVKENSLEAAEC